MSQESNLEAIEFFSSLPEDKQREFKRLTDRMRGMTTDEDVQNVFELLEASSPELFRAANGRGETLLHLACKSSLCRFELIQYLGDRFPKALQHKRDNKRTPLHLVCDNGSFSLEVVRYLVELYPKALEEGIYSGRLPVHLACQNRSCSLEILQCLVQKYPDAVEKRGAVGVPLHLACRNPSFSLQMIRYLVDQNSMALQMTDRNKCLPLHLAVSADSAFSPEIVQYLLEQYPDALQHQNWHGFLPLHCCILSFSRNQDAFDSRRLFQLLKILLPGYPQAIHVVPNRVRGIEHWPTTEELDRYKQASDLLLEEIHIEDQSEWASQVVEALKALESFHIGSEFVRKWAAEWHGNCRKGIVAIQARLGELGTLLEEARRVYDSDSE